MTYPYFDAINPERSIVFLPMDGQWRQDVGANLVTNGDFEAGLTGWTPSNSVLTLEGDAHSGAQCMRVTQDGTFVNGRGLSDVVDMTGKMVHGGAWVRGDGICQARIHTGGGFIYDGSLSWPTPLPTVWTEVEGTCLGLFSFNVYAYAVPAVAGLYIEYDDLFLYDHPQVTRSLALQPGALNYARMGDGHTAASMPTQRAGGRGLTFNGGQYIDCTDVADYVTGQNWTIASYVKLFGSGSDAIWSRRTVAGADQYYLLVETLDNLAFVDTAGTIIRGSKQVRGQERVIVATCESGFLRLYVDGVLDVSAPVSLTSVPGANFYFGSRYTSNEITGTMYQSAIYPFALTPAQVREWGRRAQQARNI